MAIKEYAGAIILEVDGQEIEVASFKPLEKTGVKPVKAMKRNGRIAGFARGIAEYELDISVVIPLTGDLQWKDVIGAKLTQYPIGGKGPTITYTDVCVSEVGETYETDNEAKRDIKAFAVNKVVE